MPKRDDAKLRARYTLEFKLEAVRLVKSGQEASVTARVLGMPKATLSNWVRACEKGVPQGAGDKPVNAEQMALARLRAELARVKIDRDILKKGDPDREMLLWSISRGTRTLQGNLCEVRLDCQPQGAMARHSGV